MQIKTRFHHERQINWLVAIDITKALYKTIGFLRFLKFPYGINLDGIRQKLVDFVKNLECFIFS